MIKYMSFGTPLGWIVIVESSLGIAMVDFLGPECPSARVVHSAVQKDFPGETLGMNTESELRSSAKAYILKYLESRQPIPAVQLDLTRGTSFDREIWSAIGSIPFGETRSYSQIAQDAGKPRAVRAAGRACGRNPVPLLIPCHRVVTSSGKPGGFSAGLDLKKALLDLERAGR